MECQCGDMTALLAGPPLVEASFECFGAGSGSQLFRNERPVAEPDRWRLVIGNAVAGTR